MLCASSCWCSWRRVWRMCGSPSSSLYSFFTSSLLIMRSFMKSRCCRKKSAAPITRNSRPTRKQQGEHQRGRQFARHLGSCARAQDDVPEGTADRPVDQSAHQAEFQQVLEQFQVGTGLEKNVLQSLDDIELVEFELYCLRRKQRADLNEFDGDGDHLTATRKGADKQQKARRRVAEAANDLIGAQLSGQQLRAEGIPEQGARLVDEAGPAERQHSHRGQEQQRLRDVLALRDLALLAGSREAFWESVFRSFLPTLSASYFIGIAPVKLINAIRARTL